MAPELGAMVTHRPEVSVVSTQSFSINRYLCWLRWGRLKARATNFEQTHYLGTQGVVLQFKHRKRTFFFKCLLILLRKYRARVDAQKYKTLPFKGVRIWSMFQHQQWFSFIVSAVDPGLSQVLIIVIICASIRT